MDAGRSRSVLIALAMCNVGDGKGFTFLVSLDKGVYAIWRSMVPVERLSPSYSIAMGWQKHVKGSPILGTALLANKEVGNLANGHGKCAKGEPNIISSVLDGKTWQNTVEPILIFAMWPILFYLHFFFIFGL